MTSRLRSATLALVVAWGAGCGVPEDGEPRRIATDDIPFGLAEAASPTTTEPAGPSAVAVDVCLLTDGRLTVVGREIEPGAGTLLGAAFAELSRPGDLDTAIRDTALGGVERVGDRATVDLAGGFGELDPGRQLLAIGQIGCTATSFPGVEEVAFTLAGRPVEVPLQDGTLVARPVRRADYAELAGAPSGLA